MKNNRDDQFIERYVECQSGLYRFIATLVPNRADAEELFQEAGQPVVVDGSLSEWDRQMMFRSQCDGAKDHAVEGGLKYDADYLYLGAAQSPD